MASPFQFFLAPLQVYMYIWSGLNPRWLGTVNSLTLSRPKKPSVMAAKRSWDGLWSMSRSESICPSISFVIGWCLAWGGLLAWNVRRLGWCSLDSCDRSYGVGKTLSKRIILRKVCNRVVFTFLEVFLSLLNKSGLHFCCQVMYVLSTFSAWQWMHRWNHQLASPLFLQYNSYQVHGEARGILMLKWPIN